MSACGVCGAAVGDGWVCAGCRGRARSALTDLPGLGLGVSMARQGRSGVTVGVTSRGATRPLPVDLAAGLVLAEVRAVLLGGLQLTDPAFRLPPVFPLPVPLLCQAFADQLRWLCHREDGADAVGALLDVWVRARVVVDLPADRVYAGPCHEPAGPDGGEVCGGELYAAPQARSVTCPVCDAVHDVPARRAWLLDAVREVTATAQDAADALSSLATPVNAATIRSWAHRGRLIAVDRDAAGRARYRMGSVMDLVVERRSR